MMGWFEGTRWRSVLDRVARRWVDRSRSERIGIVGAGFAGLHLAWLLRRHGFRVTVFERSDRIAA